MKSLRTAVTFILALCMSICLFPGTVLKVSAASKPAKPVITLTAGKDNASIKVTISETDNALGYQIYMRSAGEEEYKKVKTLKKDGSVERSYTIKNLDTQKYRIKVRAYTKKSNGKTVYGAYSTPKTLSLIPTPTPTPKPVSNLPAGYTADKETADAGNCKEIDVSQIDEDIDRMVANDNFGYDTTIWFGETDTDVVQALCQAFGVTNFEDVVEYIKAMPYNEQGILKADENIKGLYYNDLSPCLAFTDNDGVYYFFSFSSNSQTYAKELIDACGEAVSSIVIAKQKGTY